MAWNTPLPIYVTRKTADGYTGTYSLSGWAALLIMWLVCLNIFVWSCIGLYEAAKVVLG